jgi:tRNA splicing ligase
METSYKKVFEFQSAANQFIAQNPEETKLKSALEDLLEQVPDIRDKFNKHSNRIRRKHAAEDKYGCILREENGGYKFTKAGEEKAEDELQELLESTELVEIDPVIVDKPSDFPKELIRFFKGFVFEN